MIGYQQPLPGWNELLLLKRGGAVHTGVPDSFRQNLFPLGLSRLLGVLGIKSGEVRDEYGDCHIFPLWL